MKKVFLILIVLSSAFCSFGQKFGYVDTDFILNKMPDFNKAQEELDKISSDWEDEIRQKSKDIQGMYAALKAEEVLLTPEMKKERLEDIEKLELELKDYQREVFGFEGLLFLKQQELVKPIQDKIFDAIEKVSRANRLSVMFDKAADIVMIYTDPRYDYTDFVLDELGLGDPNDVLK